MRFSRPTASLVFSRNLVVTEFDGVPTLMLRVANQRHQPMVEAYFRVMMIRTELTMEGEEIARFYDLRLQVPSVIAFPAALTIRHAIDERSPMYGMTEDDFKKDHARFSASVVCIDTVVPASVQSSRNYAWGDVRFGERFVEIYKQAASDNQWTVDYGRLHETERTEVERMKDEG